MNNCVANQKQIEIEMLIRSCFSENCLVYILRFRIILPDAAGRTVAEGPGWTSRRRSLHHVWFAGGSGEGRDGAKP